MISSNILPHILSKKNSIAFERKIAKKKPLVRPHFEVGRHANVILFFPS
jgi:hypothetical protein